MHEPVLSFVAEAIADHGPFSTVIEIGSRDINGSVRPLFGGADYLGLDLRPGPGVDIVADAAEWCHGVPDLPTLIAGNPIDCVVCTEVLEHAENAHRLCLAALSWLRSGGVFIVTAAGPGRAPHSAIDEQPIREDEFYSNVSEDDLRTWLAGAASLSIDVAGTDIRAVAVKA